jgi:hypothetical protein
MAEQPGPQDLSTPIDGNVLPVTKTIVVEYTINAPETGETTLVSSTLKYPELDSGESVVACQLQSFNSDQLVFDTTVVALNGTDGTASIEVERTDSAHEWTGELILWCTYCISNG